MTMHLKLTSNQRAIVISAYVSTLEGQDKAKEAFCADLYNIPSPQGGQVNSAWRLQCHGGMKPPTMEVYRWKDGFGNINSSSIPILYSEFIAWSPLTVFCQKCKVVLLSNNSPRKYPEDTETYWGILGSSIINTYKHRKDRKPPAYRCSTAPVIVTITPYYCPVRVCYRLLCLLTIVLSLFSVLCMFALLFLLFPNAHSFSLVLLYDLPPSIVFFNFNNLF